MFDLVLMTASAIGTAIACACTIHVAKTLPQSGSRLISSVAKYLQLEAQVHTVCLEMEDSIARLHIQYESELDICRNNPRLSVAVDEILREREDSITNVVCETVDKLLSIRSEQESAELVEAFDAFWVQIANQHPLIASVDCSR